MEGFQGFCSGWSWEENKLFELALAVVDENNPARWSVVAEMVGGKSAEEVEKHFEVLVEDLQYIESGQLDHRLQESQDHHISGDCDPSIGWNDEDQEYVISLKLFRANSRLVFTSIIEADIKLEAYAS
ncbi:hypothetical protein ACLOJK_015741 [Asimina triloba]